MPVRILKVLFSPSWTAARIMLRPSLVFLPEGRSMEAEDDTSQGWNSEGVVGTERTRWESFRRNLEGTGPLGFSHEHDDLSVIRNVSFHNVHLTFAYVAALAARMEPSFSILDYGSGLGHYYLIARAVLPGLPIDYHCKEVPRIVEAGRTLLPEVRWHEDNGCLERTYDLVMMNGSLQYLGDWKDAVVRLSRSAAGYFLLTRVPVVERAGTYMTVQRAYGTRMLHRIFNQGELLDTLRGSGMAPVREFVVGDRPYVRGAPEQPELRGWLLRKKTINPLRKGTP